MVKSSTQYTSEYLMEMHKANKARAKESNEMNRLEVAQYNNRLKSKSLLTSHIEEAKNQTKRIDKFSKKFKVPKIGTLKYRASKSPPRMVVRLRSPKEDIKQEFQNERSFIKSDIQYF
jgi:hypothetical protein